MCVNGVNNAFSYRDTLTPRELHHIEVMLKLAAGDTVFWAMNVNPAPDSGGGAGAYQGNHNGCTIWLVG